MAQKIVINAVTRVEGHGKVTIQLDGAGRVTRARFHIRPLSFFDAL
jgi:NAD-reducing hydrogenase large subunit